MITARPATLVAAAFALHSCAAQTSDDSRSRPSSTVDGGTSAGAAAGSVGSGGVTATSGGYGNSAGGPTNAGGTGNATNTGGTGGFTDSGGTASGGLSSSGGSNTGGRPPVSCECNALSGTPAGSCDTPAKKSFDTGTEGAVTLFQGADESSLKPCGDHVYCGTASLMACLDLNSSVTAPPWDVTKVTSAANIQVNVTPPADGWVGKKLSASYRFDGPGFLSTMRVQLALGNTSLALVDLDSADPVDTWRTLSATVEEDDNVDDAEKRVAIFLRPSPQHSVDWQGKIYIDHITWE